MGGIHIHSNNGQINIFQGGATRRVRRRNSHPVLTGIAALFVLGLLIKFWWVVALVLAVWGGVKGFRE